MRKEQIRLFENPLLERLTRARPLTIALVWGAAIGGLAGWSAALPGFSPGPALAWAAAGWAAWTLFEYSLHRHVFHWAPDHAWGRRLVFLIHGCHHAQPDDPERGVMPLIASVPLAPVLYAATLALVPAPWAGAAFAGFLAGYLHYDLTHWACHHARPRTFWGRLVKRHHLRHHHADRDGNWGVGTPVWDRVFGTVLTDKA
jgi:sterol desaturase/sphingolipid hydroxylase (fatty acid hydroxylase superfamily)